MSHSLPEQHGADVLAVVFGRGKLAIQRKAFPDDFLASIDDGRLARELAMLSRTECPVLIVEGRPQWTADGHLMASWTSRWTRQQIRNLMRSVWLTHGVMVEHTDNINDTATAVIELETWFRKKVHRSLLSRPKQTAPIAGVKPARRILPGSCFRDSLALVPPLLTQFWKGSGKRPCPGVVPSMN
jgi:ERCC4-type nuclease